MKGKGRAVKGREGKERRRGEGMGWNGRQERD